MLHVQGQMTFERIVTLLTGLGVAISKRQLVRLMTADLDTFSAEDARVLRTGPGKRALRHGRRHPARATPARRASPRKSAPTALRCPAPARANRALRSCAI